MFLSVFFIQIFPCFCCLMVQFFKIKQAIMGKLVCNGRKIDGRGYIVRFTTIKIGVELPENKFHATKECPFAFISTTKTNIYLFPISSWNVCLIFSLFKKHALIKKESPAVYILANVTLRRRTALVWRVKLCTYCTVAALETTCWWL